MSNHGGEVDSSKATAFRMSATPRHGRAVSFSLNNNNSFPGEFTTPTIAKSSYEAPRNNVTPSDSRSVHLDTRQEILSQFGSPKELSKQAGGAPMAARNRSSSFRYKVEDEDDDVTIQHRVDPTTGLHTTNTIPRNEHFRNVARGLVTSRLSSEEDEVDRKLWEKPARDDKASYFYETDVGGYMLRHVAPDNDTIGKSSHKTLMVTTRRSVTPRRNGTPSSTKLSSAQLVSSGKDIPVVSSTNKSANQVASASSINSRYPLTLTAREYLRAAGDTDILFDSMAFAVHMTDTNSSAKSQSIGIGCQRYERGKEMLLLMCPRALYLLPSERVRSAYITEATIHINCSCPFPCLELKVLATLPQGIKKQRPRTATTDQTKTSDKGTIAQTSQPKMQDKKAFTTSTALSSSTKSSPQQRTIERFSDEEIVAQLTSAPHLLAQQQTYTRIIGFSSEVVLREAVATLTEMGKRTPSTLSAINRAGGAIVAVPSEQNGIPAAPLLRLVFHAHDWQDVSTNINRVIDRDNAQVTSSPALTKATTERVGSSPSNKMDQLRSKLANFRKERAVSAPSHTKPSESYVQGLLSDDFSDAVTSSAYLSVKNTLATEIPRSRAESSTTPIHAANYSSAKMGGVSPKAAATSRAPNMGTYAVTADDVAPAQSLADKLLEDVGGLMDELDYVMSKPIAKRKGDEAVSGSSLPNTSIASEGLLNKSTHASVLTANLGSPIHHSTDVASSMSRRTRSLINWE